MARRRRKVNQEQKDKQLKPKKPEKQPDPKMADGPFTANLRLDNKDGMTITEMQHTVGNKAVQRLVIQRFSGKPEEDQINSKVVSSPSVMGGEGQGMGMPGSVFPTKQGAEQLPIEMKGGSPTTEQQAGQNFPQSKAGSQDSLEFKVESGNSQQMSEEAPGAEISQGVDKVEQIEAQDRPTLYFGSRGPSVVALQRQLRSITPGAAGLAVDGIFGPVTRQHVLAFQEYMGLKQDGIVGQNTWRSLDYLSKGEDIDPDKQKEIREKRQEALELYLAGDFKAAKDGFEEVYLDSALAGKPLQRAGVAFNIGLCVHQLAANQELELEEQRDVLFKDAISWYMEAANTPGKADRMVDIQTNSLDRIRECRAKEPPAGEPYGLEQLDQPETAVEEELEEHEAQ
jgi:peptidoglycan hydrolase-like protein with peptidoglycan-binding domain